MDRKQESPRFLLILGGLFLIAYGAYQVGSAWMAALPAEPGMIAQTQPYPAPEEAIESESAYPGPIQTPTLISTATIDPDEPYPFPEQTIDPYPGTEQTPVPTTDPYPYPGVEGSPTVTLSTPTASPTLTPMLEYTATTDPGDPYPGPTQTLIPTIDPYPGTGQTAVPTTDPYPGTEQTAVPTADPYPGVEGSPTPILSTPTASPTPTPTQAALPTFVNTPVPVTTLPYSETMIIPGGSVNQAIWLDSKTSLALATSKGVVLHDLLEDEPLTLDEGNPIGSLVYIASEDQIAAGGRDSLIRIWDVTSGTFVRRLSGHQLGVVRLSYSPSRLFLASASDDATVRIWDDDGYHLRTLRGPNTRVLDMCVSLNGQMIAASSNQNVHIWNPLNGQLINTINRVDGWYTAVAFNPNGQILTTAFGEGIIEFWDTTTWVRQDLKFLDGPVGSLAYHPYAGLLVVGFEDGGIQIWDSRNDFLLADLAGHPEMTGLAFSPYELAIITSSADGSVRIWDLEPLLNP